MDKQFKKGLKLIFVFLGITTFIIGVGIYFSPYGNKENFAYKLLAHNVTINAPIEEVFQYLGNSNNAANWSVFVDHISTLNAHEVTDGRIGSKRRCFVQADEKGMQWDEEITTVVLNQKRQLTIFNLQKFPMTADNLATEQLYIKVNDRQTNLTFTLFFQEPPSILNHIKMYWAAYQVQPIFEKNLANIKALVEKQNTLENGQISIK